MVIKRIFDISVSFLGLMFFLPVFIAIAFLTKVLMPGPIFFSQTRIGKHGKQFIIWKLRTMRVRPVFSEATFEPGDTSRITSLGKLLRRTKIDEVIQLVNVLKGEMSLVGPRPEIKKWTEVYKDQWEIVHSVKPGITDNASIEFRNEEDILSQSIDSDDTYRNIILPRKLTLYIDYINNQSFWGDVKIILRTINAVYLK